MSHNKNPESTSKDMVLAEQLAMYQSFAHEIWSEDSKTFVVELAMRVPMGFAPKPKSATGVWLQSCIAAVTEKGEIRRVAVHKLVQRLHGHIIVPVPEIQELAMTKRASGLPEWAEQTRARSSEPAPSLKWVEDLINAHGAASLADVVAKLEKQPLPQE